MKKRGFLKNTIFIKEGGQDNRSDKFREDIRNARLNKVEPIHPEEKLWAPLEDDGFKTYLRFKEPETVGEVKNYSWLTNPLKHLY